MGVMVCRRRTPPPPTKNHRRAAAAAGKNRTDAASDSIYVGVGSTASKPPSPQSGSAKNKIRGKLQKTTMAKEKEQSELRKVIDIMQT